MFVLVHLILNDKQTYCVLNTLPITKFKQKFNLNIFIDLSSKLLT